MRRLMYATAMVASAVALTLPAVADATGSVNVTLSDFKVVPAKSSASAGQVTFVVRNAAGMAHQLVVIRTSRKAADLPVSGARASEKGKVGEVDDIGGGATKKLTLALKKGHYALICNLPGHYQGGMHADFTVR